MILRVYENKGPVALRAERRKADFERKLEKWIDICIVLVVVLVLVLAAVHARGSATPELTSLSEPEWKKSVAMFEQMANDHRLSSVDRQLFTAAVHLAHEGMRLGYVNGLAECAADEIGGKP